MPEVNAAALAGAAASAARLLRQVTAAVVEPGRRSADSPVAVELQQWLPHAAVSLCTSVTAYVAFVARMKLAPASAKSSGIQVDTSPSSRGASSTLLQRHRLALRSELRLDDSMLADVCDVHRAVARSMAALASAAQQCGVADSFVVTGSSSKRSTPHTQSGAPPWDLFDAVALLSDVLQWMRSRNLQVRCACLLVESRSAV